MISWVDKMFLCTAVLLLICEAVSLRSRILKPVMSVKWKYQEGNRDVRSSHGCSHQEGRKMLRWCICQLV